MFERFHHGIFLHREHPMLSSDTHNFSFNGILQDNLFQIAVHFHNFKYRHAPPREDAAWRANADVQRGRAIAARRIDGLVPIVIAVGAFYGWQAWESAHAPPPPAVLHMKVTPAAEHVLVNGADVGSGALLDITPPAHGHPFRVVIQATGFASHEEMVTVGAAPLSRAITLKPVAPVAP